MDTYLVRQDHLSTRSMRDELADYILLAKWLSDPSVLEYYEGRDNSFSLKRVQQKYAPRVQRRHPTIPCLLVESRRPIGYLQYYPLSSSDCAAFELPVTACPFGMDLFIGEPAYWGHGLGTTYVQRATHYLLTAYGATHITLDPRVENRRAIRCYEKCGFQKAKVLPHHELHEGACSDSWLMVYTRPEANA